MVHLLEIYACQLKCTLHCFKDAEGLESSQGFSKSILDITAPYMLE